MTELTADQLFGIIGQQTVEIAVLKSSNQALNETVRSLRDQEIAPLKAEQYEQKIKMLEETIKELSQAKTVKNSKV